jgi:hypothetical protein
MYLYQVAWQDNQNDLVLEFKKNLKEDQELMERDKVKRLNLKYELSKQVDPSGSSIAHPVLISVKDFHIIKNAMAFSINLDEIVAPDEVEIFFTKLTIFFQSGKKKEITINKHYSMSDIGIEEDFFTEFYTAHEEELEAVNSHSITQEEIYKEVETDENSNKKRERVLLRRNHTRVTTPRNSREMTELLRENNERLENVEEALTKLTDTLNNLGGLSITNKNPPNPSALPPPPPSSPQQKRKPIKSKISALPKKRPSIGMKNSKMAFLGELKEVLNSSIQKSGEFNVRDVLKPMSEEELKQVTLKDEELEKRELNFITRNIARQEESE